MSLETPESVVGKPGGRIFGKAKCSDDSSVRRPACREYCVATRTWPVR